MIDDEDTPLTEQDINDWVEWLKNFEATQEECSSEFDKVFLDNYWDILA